MCGNDVAGVGVTPRRRAARPRRQAAWSAAATQQRDAFPSCGHATAGPVSRVDRCDALGYPIQQLASTTESLQPHAVHTRSGTCAWLQMMRPAWHAGCGGRTWRAILEQGPLAAPRGAAHPLTHMWISRARMPGACDVPYPVHATNKQGMRMHA